MYLLNKEMDSSPLVGKTLMFLKISENEARLIFEDELEIYAFLKTCIMAGPEKLGLDTPEGLGRVSQLLGKAVQAVIVEDSQTLRVDFDSETLRIAGSEDAVESFEVNMGGANIIIV